ncbi:HNH endonuclease signature motif containing protein [Modestobacter sp. VKM Ac-2986]|uniref:HNH endonuclease signature motif containing protein n=1 Tax=Modestobacter sp. VKM Ac-2986 TaxID=3004140 RepID=UPI0022AB5843|nr:HNH endonuclease signature motif containing protein [Modestobacter sp. VKM Ac-2986]MCZ2829259.1 HNH endonuclease signature motif containing protein [Modestobacter sp. VKM Ac-2986]
MAELLAPASFSETELAREMGAVADGRGQLAAYDAVLIAQLAARRPAQTDLTEDEPGHAVEGWSPARVPGVSEFVVDELALMRGISLAAATGLVERSLALVHELPATWGALADGLVDEPRANAIVRALAGQSQAAGGPVDAAVVAEVEMQALEWAVAGETPVRLRERTAAALIALDAAAADRRRKKAERAADVRTRPVGDGMSELIADLPTPVAAACRETVDTYARMAKDDGDERPIGQLRALVLSDLILRPWDTSRPSVTAHLQVIAPLPALGGRDASEAAPARAPMRGDERRTPSAWMPSDEDAASVDGSPITHQQLRELLEQLDGLCPGGLQAPVDGSLDIALVDPDTGALRATVSRRELQRLVRRGCQEHLPGPPRVPSRSRGRDGCAGSGPSAPGRPLRRASDHPPPGACDCPVLERPPRVDRYTSTPAQRRFVQARDRTCRHPGCRRPAARTDLDHVHAHADGGVTDCSNLCCLCRRHHRLKTHAPGWRFTMTADGTLSVTTPSGVTRTTHPPGLRLTGVRGRVGGGAAAELLLTGGSWSPDRGAGPDDPPPF